MSIKYVKGSEGQMTDILDFIHLCFGFKYEFGFKKFLPKLYMNRTEELHYLAMDGEKIVGVVCVYPFDIIYGDKVLKANSLGSVSAHPDYRGKGIMSSLLNMAISDMDESISFLSGNRHRYANYGYEPLGFFYKYTFDEDTFNKKIPEFNITFSEDFSKETFQIFKSQSIRANRKLHNFLEISSTWENQFISIEWENEIIGYMLRKDAEIKEFVIKDKKYAFSILKKFKLDYNYEHIFLNLPPLEKEMAKELNVFCSRIDICQNGKVNILNMEKTLEFWLNVRHSYKKFHKDFVLQVNDEKYKIVIGKEIEVSVSEEKADYITTKTELFGIEGFIIESDFPLPLYVSNIDFI